MNQNHTWYDEGGCESAEVAYAFCGPDGVTIEEAIIALAPSYLTTRMRLFQTASAKPKERTLDCDAAAKIPNIRCVFIFNVYTSSVVMQYFPRDGGTATVCANDAPTITKRILAYRAAPDIC
jgi:hypothetical protein